MNPLRFSRCRSRAIAWLLVLMGGVPPRAPGSDHADPQSVYPFFVQGEPEANITDLHAFIVDDAGRVMDEGADITRADQLIISLCARRRLLPDQIAGLMLDGYTFRVHLDLDPPVRFADEAGAKERGIPMAQIHAERSMQALYGGIITQPNAIAEEVMLEFQLDLLAGKAAHETEAVIQGEPRADGVPGEINIVKAARKAGPGIRPGDFKAGAINVCAGIFDDPFIFPRFFRGNVVGIVTSIPLSQLRLKDGTSVKAALQKSGGPGATAKPLPVVLWATTHKGARQIDHVGRSLRTQLPRFGYLNDRHPSEHVAAITRVHDRPNLLEDVLATFIAPLEAHRHYDSAPDVMIYDLRKPAVFPNGRALNDDVAKTLADAGETLLLELSYAESRQFPRATTNDKPFRDAFPYLADRWTEEEIKRHRNPGTSLAGGFIVPHAQDADATAFPSFKNATWRSLWLGAVIALVVLTVLVWFLLRSRWWRFVCAAVAIGTICALQPVRADNLTVRPGVDGRGIMRQPTVKVMRLLIGKGVIAVFAFASIYLLGKRRGERAVIGDRAS